ncbi:MAG TPA: recombinase family protein, partial [Candidatus Limnocylindria bacterium]|nr:recombinase family protein [Candidatus Limnocylindria bacterium]
KHERGEPLGRLPETFCRDAAGRIVPHPELAKTVLEGAQRYATGRYGFGDLAKWAAAEGHRTPLGRALTDEWWRNVLGNPLIAGYVGYHRKRGGKELRRATFAGFVPLDLFERLQEVRRTRSRLPRRAADRRIYVLSGVARCASCAGQVTASSKERLRCRRASQHDACVEPSVRADTIDREMGTFVREALSLPAALRPRLAALVRAKVARGRDEASAERLRAAMKRLTDAYTWGGIGEADYREQLAALREQLAKSDRAPDERRVMEAIRVAQDFGLAWDKARPERRHEMVSLLFESVTIGRKRVVSVRPRGDVAPLLAVKLVQSGGPDRGSKPPDCNRRNSRRGR